MKTFLPLFAIAAASLLASCDTDVNVPPASGDKTTIINPPAEEKKVENNTTVVNPPATDTKTESSKTETTTTTPAP